MKKNKKLLLITTIIAITGFIVFFIIREFTLYIETPSQEALGALKYVSWVPVGKDMAKKGVTKYDKNLSYNGISLYSNRTKSAAYLIDMSGRVLHSWSPKNLQYRTEWFHVELDNNGNLLVIDPLDWLQKIDWNSNIKWTKRIGVHHDIAIAENNDIYTLVSKYEKAPEISKEKIIINDYLTIFTPDGKLKREVSLAKILSNENALINMIKNRKRKILRYFNYSFRDFKEHPKNVLFFLTFPAKAYRFVMENIWGARDIFHTNTVEIIDRDIFSGNKRLFKKGDILICIKNLNLIGVIDIEEERLVWSWGMGILDEPHHPSLLKNGNILIFDNGTYRGYSRIIELNPVREEIVWEYKASPPELFYSVAEGGCQKLPNGNVLITNSTSGQVFEITEDGEVVWEFYSPEIKKDTKERAAIYRMMRIIDPENYPCLKRLK